MGYHAIHYWSPGVAMITVSVPGLDHRPGGTRGDATLRSDREIVASDPQTLL